MVSSYSSGKCPGVVSLHQVILWFFTPPSFIQTLICIVIYRSVSGAQSFPSLIPLPHIPVPPPSFLIPWHILKFSCLSWGSRFLTVLYRVFWYIQMFLCPVEGPKGSDPCSYVTFRNPLALCLFFSCLSFPSIFVYFKANVLSTVAACHSLAMLICMPQSICIPELDLVLPTSFT